MAGKIDQYTRMTLNGFANPEDFGVFPEEITKSFNQGRKGITEKTENVLFKMPGLRPGLNQIDRREELNEGK